MRWKKLLARRNWEKIRLDGGKKTLERNNFFLQTKFVWETNYAKN